MPGAFWQRVKRTWPIYLMTALTLAFLFLSEVSR